MKQLLEFKHYYHAHFMQSFELPEIKRHFSKVIYERYNRNNHLINLVALNFSHQRERKKKVEFTFLNIIIFDWLFSIDSYAYLIINTLVKFVKEKLLDFIENYLQVLIRNFLCTKKNPRFSNEEMTMKDLS